MEQLALILLVTVFTAWASGRMARPDAPLQLLDRPNERSLHTQPTPRTGGIAICGGICLGWIALPLTAQLSTALYPIAAGALIVMAVSLADDRYGLSPLLRLGGHLIAAGVLLVGGFVPAELSYPGGTWQWHPAVAVSLVALLVVWMINLYNFMDGMDGFAGGMAAIGFGVMGLLGWNQEVFAFAGAALVVAAAAGGFLVCNFPPARIFMGDSGSATLGFLAAGFALWGVREQVFDLWVPLLIFSPFVVDATVTLVRRALKRERLWEAHCSHYYQRLVRMGWGHRRTVLAEYALMGFCAASAVFGSYAGLTCQWALLVLWAVVYGSLGWKIHSMERHRSETGV